MKIPETIKEMIFEGRISPDGYVNLHPGEDPEEVYKNVLARLKEAEEKSRSSKEIKYISRLRDCVLYQMTKLDKATDADRPVTQSQLQDVLANVEQNFAVIRDYLNKVSDTLRYAINLGEVVFQTLLDEGVLTLEQFQACKERLEREAKERLAKEAESASSGTN